MNEEYKKFFELPFEKREDAFFELYPNGKLLKEKLLNIGGEKVVWLPHNSHLQLLIGVGQQFSLDKRKKVKGEINHCHANAAKLFLKKNVDVVTGYALVQDRWIQHSWGYDGKKIWETTSLFDAYFGITLSGLDLSKFIFGELKNEILTLPKEQIMKIPLPDDLKEILQ